MVAMLTARRRRTFYCSSVTDSFNFVVYKDSIENRFVYILVISETDGSRKLLECKGQPAESKGLKYGSMSVADWLSSVTALALRLKTIPDMLDTNINMGIAYAHLTCIIQL